MSKPERSFTPLRDAGIPTRLKRGVMMHLLWLSGDRTLHLDVERSRPSRRRPRDPQQQLALRLSRQHGSESLTIAGTSFRPAAAMLEMLTVIPAEGAILERVLDATYPSLNEGLERPAFAKFDAALKKTAWALRHQRRLALIDGGDLLASAQQYDFTGTLDRQRVGICGIGTVCADPVPHAECHTRVLIDWLTENARRDGADLVLLMATADRMCCAPESFEVLPTVDVELTVAESSRYGAPMTLVRNGEDRDLAAIVAMGQVRAGGFRFHLERDVELVKYAITKKRLLAGLASAGARQLRFVIAEEGITAAAYVVISIVDRTWTIEECGDRDASGARVGAILQALIALEPAERRPIIRGWLPTNFVPPQVTVVSAKPSRQLILGRFLTAPGKHVQLSCEELVYWRGDLF